MLVSEKFSRNLGSISKSQQKKIQDSVFAIAGLGGTGGFALENLCRLGAQKLILFDHDCFELSNFNRQLLATDETLDMKKADAASARAKSINSRIRIIKAQGFEPGKIRNADIVIDATDSLASKLEISSSCRKQGIPYVFCSAQGAKGIVSVFSGYRLEKAFAVDGDKLKHRYCTSILCPAASLAGSLAAAQAINKLMGKPAVRAPEALFFDIFDKRIFWRGKLG